MFSPYKPYARYRFTQYGNDSWIPRETAAYYLRQARHAGRPIEVSRGRIGKSYVVDYGNRKEVLRVNHYT